MAEIKSGPSAPCGDDCQHCDVDGGDGVCMRFPKPIVLTEEQIWGPWREVEAARLACGGRMPTDAEWNALGLGTKAFTEMQVTCGWVNCIKEGRCRGHGRTPLRMVGAILRRLFCLHPFWLKGSDPYWRLGLRGWVCARCAKRIDRPSDWRPTNYVE
jgi:hypothetical protein